MGAWDGWGDAMVMEMAPCGCLVVTVLLVIGGLLGTAVMWFMR